MSHVAGYGIALAIGACLPCAALAACDATAVGDPAGYLKAGQRVIALPAFKTWHARVLATPGVRAAFGVPVDKQIDVRGVCRWTVTVYESDRERLTRWRTFLVPLKRGTVITESTD
jgi:hypothetical protein